MFPLIHYGIILCLRVPSLMSQVGVRLICHAATGRREPVFDTHSAVPFIRPLMCLLIVSTLQAGCSFGELHGRNFKSSATILASASYFWGEQPHLQLLIKNCGTDSISLERWEEWDWQPRISLKCFDSRDMSPALMTDLGLRRWPGPMAARSANESDDQYRERVAKVHENLLGSHFSRSENIPPHSFSTLSIQLHDYFMLQAGVQYEVSGAVQVFQTNGLPLWVEFTPVILNVSANR